MNELVDKYNKEMPEDKRNWLKSKRGLTDEIINKYKLGYNGTFFTIPITDKEGKYVFLKLRKDPDDASDGPKYRYSSSGLNAELFGWEHITDWKDTLIVCEGELDKLLLESNGIAAVTGTSGATTFPQKWADAINNIPSQAIICMDNDEAGRRGEEKISLLIPHARIVRIPKLDGVKDVSDFILSQGIEKFRELLKTARTLKEIRKQEPLRQDGNGKKEEENTQLRIIEDDITIIHPAMDFTKDTAVITILLPTQRVPTEEEKDISLPIDQAYWMVTSKKEIFPLNTDELLKRGFHSAGVCYVMNNRWNYKNSLKLWLNSNVDVNPAEIFLRIKEKYEYYLDYREPRLYTFLPLWDIGTYFFPIFAAYPIVFLTGVSGAGKSKSIEISEQVAFNAINTSNISDASIYRVIQGTRATLLLDENEKIADSEEAKVLINLVLAGFKKGAQVIRLEKNKHQEFVPTKFEVHCPKMIANIRGIYEEALKNRCITFQMTPTQDNRANLYPSAEDPEWQDIRNCLYILQMNHWQKIRETKRRIIASDFGLSGYSFMMWQPILTIAKYLEPFVGDEPLKAMTSLAADKTAERKKELLEGYDRQLLKVVWDMVSLSVDNGLSDEDVFLPVIDIFENFRTYLGFEEHKLPKWFTPQKVGRMVNSLDIGDRKTEENVRGYVVYVDRLKTILNRFGIM